jgi:hypothetical protein
VAPTVFQSLGLEEGPVRYIMLKYIQWGKTLGNIENGKYILLMILLFVTIYFSIATT